METLLIFIILIFVYAFLMDKYDEMKARKSVRNEKKKNKNSSFAKKKKENESKSTTTKNTYLDVRESQSIDLLTEFEKSNLKKEVVRFSQESITLFYVDHYHPYKGGNNSKFNKFSSRILDFKKGDPHAQDYFYKQLINSFKKINRQTNLFCVPSHSPQKNSQIAKLIERLVQSNPKYLNNCSDNLKRDKKIQSLSKGSGNRKIHTHLNSISANLWDAFSPKYDNHNIIIDDVCTTGSSIIGCSKILENKGLKPIFHLCLARTYHQKDPTLNPDFWNSEPNDKNKGDDLPF